jgi:hypothetical protein
MMPFDRGWNPRQGQSHRIALQWNLIVSAILPTTTTEGYGYDWSPTGAVFPLKATTEGGWNDISSLARSFVFIIARSPT